MRYALVALLLVGCRRDVPAKLDAYLAGLAGADAETRRDAVRGWKLDESAWPRFTTDPYRAAYRDYERQFALALPGLVDRLARAGKVTTRPHFAGDPRLTPGQARARWAQPVQAPSEIADLDGAPIDAVFVRDGDAWRVIVGVDAIVRDRAAHLDAACGALFDALKPGACADAAWVVAEAALRDDRPRFARACAQATNLCR